MAELAFLDPEEIQTVRDLLQVPSLGLVVNSHWGSQAPQYREQIHAHLATLTESSPQPLISSISHSRHLGGFAFAMTADDGSAESSNEKPHLGFLQLGFDIEEDARVTAEVARRICITQAEFDRAPSFVSLWAAKEAAFKSLKGPKQPVVVSAFEIVNWKILNSQYETASLKDPQYFGSSRIEGVLVKKSAMTLAFFARHT